MAKNKGKRRSKAPANRQGSPSKSPAPALSREPSPAAPGEKDLSEEAPPPSAGLAAEQTEQNESHETVRKVSSRVAQFEQAARAESLLNHERKQHILRSPAQLTSGSVPESEDPHHNLHLGSPQSAATPFAVLTSEPEAEPPSRNNALDSSPLPEPLHGHDSSPEISSFSSPVEIRDELLRTSSDEPEIPQRSVARDVEVETAQTFAATRQQVMIARPVMLESVDDSRDNVDSDVDLDSYFDSPDDIVVTAATVRKIESPEVPQSPRFADVDFDMESATIGGPADPSASRDTAHESETPLHPKSDEASDVPKAAASDVGDLRTSKLHVPDNSAQYFKPPEGETSMSDMQQVPQISIKSQPSIRAVPPDPETHEPATYDYEPQQDQSNVVDEAAAGPKNAAASTVTKSRDPATPKLGESVLLHDNGNMLPRPPTLSAQSSPTASPRAYKYEQSPLPKPEDLKTEPPIIGVCVVGFHHHRGPEVEYWVGPDESQSSMWPYLPFQSLPDGSHQFEENVTYFMLLYDRDRHAATSLTFDRDEDGHIKNGTTDFRNVTTLFAVACSRQIAASELQLSEDEEYTRSTVQKSVVVIASKPLFGPIKEKLTVVTRSYFAQRNFGDRGIIDHFYHNLVQMPLWSNENDLHVGMNLQKCIHDFGAQALYLFKAMLLEAKILFYASDTDVLGTTQFALVSLIPNLINHLEDSGSPLLSSYELELQPPTHVSSSDRQSLLKYFGLPLQLFAGGGVFSPFVPLQQFDDLKQPETQYGMMGTTNKLFLGTDIDFDVVVNVDTSEVVARNPEVGALLQLTDPDKAFISTVEKAVNVAWDTHDSWQPQALGYFGGEDYIRHQFEEYLMALLASAKYEQHGRPENSSAPSPLSYYGSAWSENWMRTNNFRISNRNTDKRLFDLVDPVHPGVKLQKPSGIERFFGIFKSSSSKNVELPKSSSASVASQSSSAPRTPSLASSEKFNEQPTPATPSTPRRWFWQSDRSDSSKTDTPKTSTSAKTDASVSESSGKGQSAAADKTAKK